MTYGLVSSLWNPLLLKGGLRWRGNALASSVLDALSAFPVVAYSVRQLTGGPYSRPYCMLVRRSTDNASQNIGYANGVLNTAQILAFCGSGSGYVVTWYNQGSLGSSGDATQSTAAFQPQVCVNGVVEIQNGRPAIQFLGASSPSFFNIPPNVNPIGTQPSWLNLVAQESSVNFCVMIATGSSYLRGLYFNNSNLVIYYPPQNTGAGVPVFSGNAMTTATYSSTNPSVNLYHNGTNVFSVNSTLNGDTTSGLRLGQGVSSSYWQTNAQEAIYGLSNLSTSDRTTLELSQAAFYNIAGVTQ